MSDECIKKLIYHCNPLHVSHRTYEELKEYIRRKYTFNAPTFSEEELNDLIRDLDLLKQTSEL